MKTVVTFHKPIATLTLALLLNTGGAWAAPCPCPMPMAAQAPTSACPMNRVPARPDQANAQASAPASNCAMSDDDVGRMLGSLAASGLHVATRVLSAIADEANRLVRAEPDWEK